MLTDWERYLAPWINDLVPGSAHTAMLLVASLALALLAAGRHGPRVGSAS